MKEKHLEFTLGVINRMGQNSFLIKGWTVTLISALFALAAKEANQKFVIIAYFPTITFWLLDGYFLYQERLFRKVYDHVCKANIIDFSLNTKEFDNGFFDWTFATLSKTLILFYGIVFITLIIVMYYLK
jgi:hypothetical protein